MIYDGKTCQTCMSFRCDGIGPRGVCLSDGSERTMSQRCGEWLEASDLTSVFVVRDMADGGEPLKAFLSLDAAREDLAREGLAETDRGWESDDGEWMQIEEVATCRG